jgi:uncharacterized membrane protein
MYHEPERTSIAAILGLVLSCIGCCGGVTAIFGIFLSIFGIVGIARSKGRIGGMGFAIAGLLIGLLTLAMWGGILGASSFGFNWVEKNAAAPTVQVLQDIEAGNFDAARAGLGSPAADVSDEVFVAFREGYLGTLGPVVSETHGIVEMFTGYGAVGQQIQNYNGRPNHIPVPVNFDSGPGLVVIEINPNQANSGSLAPIRMFVVDTNGNEYPLPPYDWKAPDSGDPVLPGVDVEDFSDDGSDSGSGGTDDGP